MLTKETGSGAFLNVSGLTPRLYDAQEDGELLKLGYGFTNIVARPTRGMEDITKEEYAEGRQILRQKLEKYRPDIACFVGKGVYTPVQQARQSAMGIPGRPGRQGDSGVRRSVVQWTRAHVDG